MLEVNGDVVVWWYVYCGADFLPSVFWVCSVVPANLDILCHHICIEVGVGCIVHYSGPRDYTCG